jgi:hypothetical protein
MTVPLTTTGAVAVKVIISELQMLLSLAIVIFAVTGAESSSGSDALL